MSLLRRRPVLRALLLGLSILPCALAVLAAGCADLHSSAKQTASDCLECHGPFDKLVADSSKYIAPSGEKISPHRYVPHDSKLVKDIPECLHCHATHPLDPLPGAKDIDLSKVNVDWCYSCHHEKTFQSCKDCHP